MNELMIQPSEACYQGNGDSYTGRVNKTSSGRVCQWWKNQQPHPHHLLPSFIPYLQHNHCRNPGAVRLRPWCFTMDVDVEWEYCGVPHCGLCCLFYIEKIYIFFNNPKNIYFIK